MGKLSTVPPPVAAFWVKEHSLTADEDTKRTRLESMKFRRGLRKMNLVAKQKPKGDKQDDSFGTRLRAIRQAAGLTQEELGQRVGMAYQSIAKYERGALEPKWSTVVKLAEALGVEPNDFLGDDLSEEDKPAKKPKK